jgi:hypothetical protein
VSEPVWRRRCSRRRLQDSLTAKRSAISARVSMRSSQAAATRTRKSSENAAMPATLLKG